MLPLFFFLFPDGGGGARCDEYFSPPPFIDRAFGSCCYVARRYEPRWHPGRDCVAGVLFKYRTVRFKWTAPQESSLQACSATVQAFVGAIGKLSLLSTVKKILPRYPRDVAAVYRSNTTLRSTFPVSIRTQSIGSSTLPKLLIERGYSTAYLRIHFEGR